MIAYIASSLVFGFAGLMIYIYYLKKGQFEDLEDIKYQIFHNEENEGK